MIDVDDTGLGGTGTGLPHPSLMVNPMMSSPCTSFADVLSREVKKLRQTGYTQLSKLEIQRRSVLAKM